MWHHISGLEKFSQKKRKAKLVTVTNQLFPRSLTTSFEFSQEKHFFFSTSLKYEQLSVWLKTLNLKRYASKYKYQKG